MMDTIGSRIKYVREIILNVSQKELAAMIGISQASLAVIESNRVAQPRKIERLATALGVTKEWLLIGGELKQSINPPISEKKLIENNELEDLKHRVRMLELYILNKSSPS